MTLSLMSSHQTSETAMRFLADELPEPIVLPASGIYRPPLIVTIIRGTDRHSDDDVVFYSLHHTFEANSKDTSQAPRAQPYATSAGRYDGPLRIDSAGKVKITAFQHREGVGKGRPVVALYVLEHGAPPAPDPSPAMMAASFPGGVPKHAHNDDESHRTREILPGPSQTAAPGRRTAAVAPNSSVVFLNAPGRIRARRGFDVSVQPVDIGVKVAHFTVQLSLELYAPPAEGSGTLSGPTTIRIERRSTESAMQMHLVEWERVHNVQVIGDGTTVTKLDSFGLRPGQQNTEQNWDSSFCISRPIMFKEFRAVRFVLNSLCRAIVGFMDADVHHPAKPVTRWVGAPQSNSKEGPSWKDLRHALHVNYDGSAGAFRVYESGVFVPEGGTHDCREGDWFAVEYRHDCVAYIHNGDVFYTSPDLTPASMTKAMRCGVYVVEESCSPSLIDVVLLPRNDPRVVTFRDVSWMPPTTTMTGIVPALLRCWVVGHDNTTTAVHKLEIECTETQLPPWVRMSSLLAFSFMAGVVGVRADEAKKLFAPKPTGVSAAPPTAPLNVREDEGTLTMEELRRDLAAGRLEVHHTHRTTDMQECLNRGASWAALRAQRPIVTNRASAGLPELSALRSAEDERRAALRSAMSSPQRSPVVGHRSPRRGSPLRDVYGYGLNLDSPVQPPAPPHLDGKDGFSSAPPAARSVHSTVYQLEPLHNSIHKTTQHHHQQQPQLPFPKYAAPVVAPEDDDDTEAPPKYTLRDVVYASK